jgi:branched-chain amino acid transport system substrate-binding protein
VQVIKQAAEQAKSLDPKKVADVMHSGKSFDTVLGDIAFDKKGDLSFDKKGDVSDNGYLIAGKKKDRYALYTWKKGPDGNISYFENP